VCGADRNYAGYCNPQLDELIDRQSMGLTGETPENGVGDRKRLAEDNVRPVIFYPRQASCSRPRVRA
jgi:hypothetical protein